MTPKERAAMQAAWVWMDWYSSNNGTLEPVDFNETITALREALAEQAEQSQLADASLEPVAWYSVKGGFNTCGEGKPLYAAPLRTKNLTDDEISRLWYDSSYGDSGIDFARAVIAKFKEKNRG